MLTRGHRTRCRQGPVGEPRRPWRVRDEPRSFEQTEVGVGWPRGPGQNLTNETEQRLPKRLGLLGAWRGLVREHLCHAVGQSGNEARGLARRQPEGPGTDVALPEREHHGGVAGVGRDTHPPNRAPGVEEPGPFAQQVALHRHAPIMAPALSLATAIDHGSMTRLFDKRREEVERCTVVVGANDATVASGRPAQPGGTSQCTRSVLRASPMRACPHPPNCVSSVLPA